MHAVEIFGSDVYILWMINVWGFDMYLVYFFIRKVVSSTALNVYVSEKVVMTSPDLD